MDNLAVPLIEVSGSGTFAVQINQNCSLFDKDIGARAPSKLRKVYLPVRILWPMARLKLTGSRVARRSCVSGPEQ